MLAYPPPPLDEALKAVRSTIKCALKHQGTHTHNIVGSALRTFSAYHGIEEANKLVDEFDLAEKLGIERAKNE